MQIFSASSLSSAAVQEPAQRARRTITANLGLPGRQTVSDLIAGHHDVKAGALIGVKVGIVILLG